jgi:DNA-binding transcriptional LysR family regulator
MNRSHAPDELADLFDRPGLSLERLRSLVRVADAGGIAAATDSPSEQSQISRQLGDLEEYLGGAELTRRRGRTLELTDDGRELAARAREFLRNVAGLRQKAAPDAPVLLALGGGDSVLAALAIPAVAAVARRTPRLEVSLTSLPAERPVAAIESGRLHAVVAREEPRARALEATAVGPWDVRLYAPRSALVCTPVMRSSSRDRRRKGSGRGSPRRA